MTRWVLNAEPWVPNAEPWVLNAELGRAISASYEPIREREGGWRSLARRRPGRPEPVEGGDTAELLGRVEARHAASLAGDLLLDGLGSFRASRGP